MRRYQGCDANADVKFWACASASMMDRIDNEDADMVYKIQTSPVCGISISNGHVLHCVDVSDSIRLYLDANGHPFED